MKKFKKYLEILFCERGFAEVEDPTLAAKQELETTKAQLAEETKRREALENEKRGIFDDLKTERQKRQELEQTLNANKRHIDDQRGDLEIDDEEIIDGKRLKRVLKVVSDNLNKRDVNNVEIRAAERVAMDEMRIQELSELNPKKYPIDYDEAIEEFTKLANADPSLWEQYDAQKYKAGGRPAEFAYRLALRESPKFREVHEKRIREEVVDKLNEDKDPKKLKGGGSGAGKTGDRLSDSDISNMTDAELAARLRTT